MGGRHPLLLIPDALVIAAYSFVTDHTIAILSAIYFIVGIAVGVKQLLK